MNAEATLANAEHERVVIRQDQHTGLRMIIAVHSTVLGPALGGLRIRAYDGGMTEALQDVLALSSAMTLKASAAGLDLGGGKAVICDDGVAATREARLELAGEVIDELGGAYVTAEDIGTSTADMEILARRTRWVVGRDAEHGGQGDPSPLTAETVFRSILLGLRDATGTDSLEGRVVGVIGLGKVGRPVAERLAAGGANLLVADAFPGRAEEFAAEHGGELRSPHEIAAAELDVLCPCATGGFIDGPVAARLRTRVIAGAANNPLAHRDLAAQFHRAGVLYVPDFLANCGGLINVHAEFRGLDQTAVQERIDAAMDQLERVLATARAEGAMPLEIAERIAGERIAAARASRPSLVAV